MKVTGTEAKERNMGIELLRMVSMLAIVVLHVLGKGGVLENTVPMSAGYEAAWFLEILCYFGVTAYALISGYVSLSSDFKLFRLLYLWLQVFFYTSLTTLLFLIFKREAVTAGTVKTALFPVMSEAYWYFSAYFLVFLIAPAIRCAVRRFSRVYLRAVMIVLVVLLSVLPMLFDVDVFAVRGGYSFIWLAAAYFIGAYIRKYDVFANVTSLRLCLIFFMCVILTWVSKLAIELIYGYDASAPERGNILISYNSITILLASVVLLPIFARINLKGWLRRTVKVASPLTFGVYLANCEPLIWEYIIADRFKKYADAPAWKMLLLTVLAALVIYLLGTAVDGIRRIIFELGHLREKLDKLEELLMKEKCPCCQKSRVEKYEICDICGWENDPVQRDDPDFEGGANKLSLNRFREEYEKRGN